MDEFWVMFLAQVLGISIGAVILAVLFSIGLYIRRGR